MFNFVRKKRHELLPVTFNNRYALTEGNQINNAYPNKYEIQISYKSIYDEDQEKSKRSYANDLIEQIKQNELKKELEKKRKELEDIKEEERLKREREEIELRASIEEKKREQEILQRGLENQRIMNSYSVMVHPKQKKKTVLKKRVKVIEVEKKNSFQEFLEKRKKNF